MVTRAVAAIAIALAACSYHASFRACVIACTAETGCPSGMSCGAEGLCAMPATACTAPGEQLDGGIADAASSAVPPGSFATPVPYAVGIMPIAVTVLDVNGDGNLDVIVLNQTDGTLSVLLGEGNGVLKAQLTSAAAPNAVAFGLGPVEGGTGAQALEALVAYAAGNTGDIAVLPKDGTSGFSGTDDEALTGLPVALAIAPMSVGATPDALVLSQVQGSPITSAVDDYYPSGASLARLTTNLSGPASAFAVGTFGHDQHPDVVVAFADSATAAIEVNQLNEGGGGRGFENREGPALGTNITLLAAADVDHTNGPDLIAASAGSTVFSVLEANVHEVNALPSFNAAVTHTLHSPPVGLAMFDTSSGPDAAFATLDGVSVAVNDGTGTLTDMVDVPLSGASAIAAGDLNNDGIPDLVVTAVATNVHSPGTVSVLLGKR